MKQFALVIGGLIGLLLLVSFVLPSSWEVSREMQINVENHVVHNSVSDLSSWTRWSPWGTYADPKATVKTSADTSSVGSTYDWNGPDAGKGSLKVTASNLEKGVWFDLGLRGGKEPVKGVIQYTESPAGGCMVKITLRGDVSGDPVGRYIALMRGYTVGPDLVDALLRLKRQLERGV